MAEANDKNVTLEVVLSDGCKIYSCIRQESMFPFETNSVFVENKNGYEEISIPMIAGYTKADVIAKIILFHYEIHAYDKDFNVGNLLSDFEKAMNGMFAEDPMKNAMLAYEYSKENFPHYQDISNMYFMEDEMEEE